MELRKGGRIFGAASSSFLPLVTTFARSKRISSAYHSLATARMSRPHAASLWSSISAPRSIFPLISSCQVTRKSSQRYRYFASNSEDVIKHQEKG